MAAILQHAIPADANASGGGGSSGDGGQIAEGLKPVEIRIARPGNYGTEDVAKAHLQQQLAELQANACEQNPAPPSQEVYSGKHVVPLEEIAVDAQHPTNKELAAALKGISLAGLAGWKDHHTVASAEQGHDPAGTIVAQKNLPDARTPDQLAEQNASFSRLPSAALA